MRGRTVSSASLDREDLLDDLPGLLDDIADHVARHGTAPETRLRTANAEAHATHRLAEGVQLHDVLTELSALRIRAARSDGMLLIDIYNDGPPLASSFSIEKDGGFGLRNVMQRLATWDPRANLAPRQADDGVLMRLTLPLDRRDEPRS